jgi:hypothetical protein
MSPSGTCPEQRGSAFAPRHLLMGAPYVPPSIRTALAEGRHRDAALLLASQFGLSMSDACELVK